MLCRVLSVLLLLAGVGQAATIHVPDDHATIKDGLAAATHADTVLVAPGTYTGAGNWNLDFRGTALTLKSSGGPYLTTIQGDGSNTRAFTFQSGEDRNSILDGFTITGSAVNSDGTAIRCEDYSSPTIVNCILTENTGTGSSSGAIYISNSSPLLVNCAIVNNHSNYDNGTALYLTGTDAYPILKHCTIAFNTSAYSTAYAIYLKSISASDGPYLNLWNSICWNSTDVEIYDYRSHVDAKYSNIRGGFPGLGNISNNPLFVDPEKRDYHLFDTSPCIDAGLEDGVYTDVDGDARPGGCDGFDMGFDEFTYAPPEPFSLLNPADGDTLADPDITFDWADAGTPNPWDPITYDLHYDDDPDFGSPDTVAGLTASEWALDVPLPVFTTFYWKVQAADDHCGSTWSETFSFYTDYPEAVLEIEPGSLEFTQGMNQTTADTLWFRNLGNIDLEYEISWFFDWLAIDPATGTLGPGETSAVVVEVSSDDLAPGSYDDIIQVDSNCAEDPIHYVAVSMDVLSPVSMDLEAAQSWVPRGGSLDVRLIFHNREDQRKSFYQRFWAERNGQLVWANTIEPMALDPLADSTHYYIFSVPRVAPLGFYQLFSAIGVPGPGGPLTWDMDSAGFEIVDNLGASGPSLSWDIKANPTAEQARDQP